MEVEKGFGQGVTVFICTAVVWLCVLMCQASINIPQTDCDVSLHFSAILSPYSCLGSQQHLHVKIPMGSYSNSFHPSIHLQIIGCLGSQQATILFPSLSVDIIFPVPSLLHLLGLPYEYPKAGCNHEPGHNQRIIKISIWKRYSIKHAFCSCVQSTYNS